MLGGGRAVVDPGWATDEVLDIGAGELLHLRHDLDSRRPVANHSDALVAIVVAVVPPCRVRDMALEVAQPGDAGPVLVHQHALRRDQDMAVLVPLDTLVFNRDFPLAFGFEPIRRNNTRVEVQVAVQVPFLNCRLDVGQDVGAAGVEALPVRVGVKGEGLFGEIISLVFYKLWSRIGYLHRCALARRIGRQDNCSEARCRPRRAETQRFCARQCPASRGSGAGTCVP